MRFSSAVAGLVLLFAPSIATAQDSWGPSGSWGSSGSWDATTTQYEATITVTMTLLQVNATVTSQIPKATGFNATSSAAVASSYTPLYSSSAPSYNAATVNPSATPSVCANCMQGNGASSEHVNLAMAAVAGAAALVWASL